MIVPIALVVSNNVQAIGTIIPIHHPHDRKRPWQLRRPRWFGLSSIRTIGTIVLLKYEAILWKIRKHSQKIGTIEGYHCYPSNRGEIRPGRRWSWKNTETFEPHMVACVQTPSPKMFWCNWTQHGPSRKSKSQNDPHIYKFCEIKLETEDCTPVSF